MFRISGLGFGVFRAWGSGVGNLFIRVLPGGVWTSIVRCLILVLETYEPYLSWGILIMDSCYKLKKVGYVGLR